MEKSDFFIDDASVASLKKSLGSKLKLEMILPWLGNTCEFTKEVDLLLPLQQLSER